MPGGKDHNRVFCFGVHLTTPPGSSWGICRILTGYVTEMNTKATCIPEGKTRNRVFCFVVQLTPPRVFLGDMEDS